MRSGTLKSPPGGLGGDMRVHPTLLGTQEKGGPSILLEFHTEVQKKLGHDKAHSCFTHISHSTLWNSAKFGIHRNIRSWRIQRRQLQEFWIRTRKGRRVLPGNNQTT